MKSPLSTIIYLSLVSLLTITAHSNDQKVKRVLIFGLDGLAPTELRTAISQQKAPTLKWLQESGSYTYDARSSQPTVSYTNWASILLGVDTQFHGVDSNSFDRVGKAKVLPPVWGECTSLPTFFHLIRRRYSYSINGNSGDCDLSAFFRYDMIGVLLNGGKMQQPIGRPMNYSLMTSSDQNTMLQSIDYLIKSQNNQNNQNSDSNSESGIEVMFVYFLDIDDAGHQYGFKGAEYTDAISRVDSYMSQIISQFLSTDPEMDSSLIMTVSDHGRKLPGGRYHGSFTQGEVSTFLAVAGRGVRRNHSLSSWVSNMDMAGTVLHALNVPVPVQWRAKPIYEAFENYELTNDVQKVLNATANYSTREGGNKTMLLWSYMSEPEDTDAECKEQFHLDNPIMWGVWDNASFGIGAALGSMITSIVFILIGCLFFRRPAALGGRKLFESEYSPLVVLTWS